MKQRKGKKRIKKKNLLRFSDLNQLKWNLWYQFFYDKDKIKMNVKIEEHAKKEAVPIKGWIELEVEI